MKFSQIGRITKATILSLAVGLGMTACSSDYTIDYLYVICAKGTTISSPNGSISGFKIDNQSGALTQLVDSPTDSGGINPVAITLAPNQRFLFVLENVSSRIVIFAIGTDGKIYPKNTYNPPTGVSLPVAEAISPDGKFLAVAFTYQPGFTTVSPGPGAIAIYPVTYADDLSTATLGNPVTMGAATYFPVDINPVSLGFAPCVTAPNPCPSSYVPYLYLVEQTAAQGTIRTLSMNATSGVVTAVASTQAGVTPHALAEDPTARFVYVTDQAANQLIGYLVQSNGSLTPMVNGPFAAGQFPQGIVADPRGQYLYITNYNTSTVTGYAIDQATGTPSGVFSNGSSNVGTGPTCITIEPAQGRYLYTSNFVDNTTSGMQMDPHNGALVNVQNTPFNTGGQPTCAVTASAGAHAYQAVQP